MCSRERVHRAGSRVRPPRACRIGSAVPSLSRRASALRSAADWPLDECLANEDWRERGLAAVVFVRRSPDGDRAAAGFVVDLFCRGVRDVRIAVGEPSRGRPGVGLAAVYDLVEAVGIGRMQRVDPYLAAKVVRGGDAYARTLGFAPHADYDWARVIFDRIDDAACVEPVPCGRFGKPVVLAETGADLVRLVGRLEQRLGPGGYHIVAPLDVVPEG